MKKNIDQAAQEGEESLFKQLLNFDTFTPNQRSAMYKAISFINESKIIEKLYEIPENKLLDFLKNVVSDTMINSNGKNKLKKSIYNALMMQQLCQFQTSLAENPSKENEYMSAKFQTIYNDYVNHQDPVQFCNDTTICIESTLKKPVSSRGRSRLEQLSSWLSNLFGKASHPIVQEAAPSIVQNYKTSLQSMINKLKEIDKAGPTTPTPNMH